MARTLKRIRTFIAITILTFSTGSFANTLKVCKSGCEYSKIQQAVEISKNNDVIVIGPGTYEENNILVNQNISIQSESNDPKSVIIDGTKQNHNIFKVFKTKNFVISGITLQNTGLSYTEEVAGIKMIESEGCKIFKNKFHDTTYGIYLEKSKDCEISENLFQGFAKDESSGGNAIHVWTGSGHKIHDNQIYGHRDGIYLEFASTCVIQKNDVQRNIRYGLHFMSSHQTEYYDNQFKFNGAGVAVMYSHEIKMIRNEFSQNAGPAAYGLLLKDIQNSEIIDNQFVFNTVGIYMEGSNRSKFTNNLFLRNGFGLRIMGDCENNDFTKNNFISNTFEVATNADHSWNTFKQNYWSQYSGYDLNQDAIGDITHRPVSLSSVILERVDSAYVLMRSPLFNLLDQIERSFPTLIPEPLKDDEPLMQKVNQL